MLLRKNILTHAMYFFEKLGHDLFLGKKNIYAYDVFEECFMRECMYFWYKSIFVFMKTSVHTLCECVCVCVYIYINIHVCIWMYECIYGSIHIFWKNVYVLLIIEFCFFKNKYIHPYINIHVCIQICEYIYGYLCIFEKGSFLFIINFLGVWHMDFVKRTPFCCFWKHGLKKNSLYKNKVLFHLFIVF